ncbi:PREDICTED: endogenous retrovirus group K member 25 Pol protein-like [Lepidothrix coronata]|uniref:RNA-directed DNA polymerase n=1 Tax=Lepidothrix coronata TaxID=321398 RepID=A0A6J0GWJ7_9PASS|nr:PREDICTED: endogenous retrovirus group K member 25 Pol protein-like [Lepidothrix coronata]
MVTTVPKVLEQAKLSHQFFHQNACSLKRQFQIKNQARDIIMSCSDCQQVAPMPSKEGVNPRGITANEIWQTDITHIAEFGKLKYVHVTVDTHSKYINATAHTGEKAKDVNRHWLSCFAILGIPKTIKTDNGPAYCSEIIKTFLTDWGVFHSTGIPHSPAGQAIVERAHRTLKEMLQTQKREESVYSPQEHLWKASYVVNFLNRDDTDHSRYDRQHKTQILSPSKPPVMIKDLISGQWSGPVDLITRGKGYACVSKGTKLQWILSRYVRPYITPPPQQKQSTEEMSEEIRFEEI